MAIGLHRDEVWPNQQDLLDFRQISRDNRIEDPQTFIDLPAISAFGVPQLGFVPAPIADAHPRLPAVLGQVFAYGFRNTVRQRATFAWTRGRWVACAAVFGLRKAHAFANGIESVLEQLLQHRRRPLDDFAGRDLADEQLGKDADRGHEKSI